MKRLVPLFAIIVLIGILAMLNKSMNRNVAGDEDAPPPAASAPAKTPIAAADPVPAEIILGNPASASTTITVGWVYDEANQADTAALRQAIAAVGQAVAKSGGRASAVIVNLDVPAEDRTARAQAAAYLGVFVDESAQTAPAVKNNTLAGNPGKGEATAANITPMLDKLLAGAK